ncbi:MAG: hypothetical protein E7012_01570 [Alphaproteobacteria bacterium]|nr:hypothetical protein [Alphaproteobacteria bacterium]
MNKLKAIKITVAFLTFLLVFGMLSAVGIIFKKATSSTTQSTSRPLNQPKGSKISSFKTDNNNLYLLVNGGGIDDRIIIINKQNPQSYSIINLN